VLVLAAWFQVITAINVSDVRHYCTIGRLEFRSLKGQLGWRIASLAKAGTISLEKFSARWH